MTKDMVLQKKDIALLKEWGFPDNEIPQIQEAIEVSEYELYEKKEPYKTVRMLTAIEAYRRLGNEEFLSGISRSAFHWNCTRDCRNEKYGVAFDSSTLFR